MITSRCDKENISIRIEDNGGGIKEENLPHIFEPFFTTKDIGKGIGLGMSISYEIVKKHGGDIQIQSVLGQGARFDVSFPLMKTTQAAADEVSLL